MRTAPGDSIEIDVSGELIRVPRPLAVALRDAAAVDASRSSVRRDLSLLLERALATGTTLALHRGEARELEAILRERPVDADARHLLDRLEQLSA